MVATYAAAALLFSLALYITVSVAGKRESLDIHAFFHDSGRPWMAVVSLTAYNVTLGTGVAYLLVQARNTGPLVLLTPIAITVGYLLAAWYYSRLSFQVSDSRPNIYYLLSVDAPAGGPKLGLFARIFSGFIATTYFLVLCFELGVGSGFIGSTLFKTPSAELNLGIAVCVFGVVIAYTAASGLRAAVTTDIAQFVFIIAFIAIVPYISVQYGGPSDTPHNKPHFGAIEVAGSALAILTAISTQFYSIVNPQIATSYTPNQQRKILAYTGLSSGALYLAIAWIGLSVPSKDSLEASIRSFLYDPAGASVGHGILAFMLFAGMIAILLSTLDNLCIAVAELYHDLALSAKRSSSRGPSAPEFSVKGFRVIYVAVGMLAVPVTIFLYLTFTNTFFLLLSILFAAGVLAPSVFTAMFLRATGRPTLLDRPAFALGAITLTLAGWAWYLYLTAKGRSAEGTLFHLVAFGAGGFGALYDYLRNRRLAPTGVSTQAGNA